MRTQVVDHVPEATSVGGSLLSPPTGHTHTLPCLLARARSPVAVTGYEEAREIYEDLHLTHPARLEQMDVLSNVYYVLNDVSSLAELARRAQEIDRFRPETCCVVGEGSPIRPGDSRRSGGALGGLSCGFSI